MFETCYALLLESRRFLSSILTIKSHQQVSSLALLCPIDSAVGVIWSRVGLCDPILEDLTFRSNSSSISTKSPFSNLV